MKRVIDASVALKWVLDEPGRAAADTLLDDELIAPDLWLVEAANALWKRAGRGDISVQEAGAMLAELRNAPVSSVVVDLSAAMDLALELKHPVYDCLYLAAAIREDSHVVTADRRFYAVTRGAPDLADRVRLLA